MLNPASRRVHTVGFALTFRGATEPAARRIVEMQEGDCLTLGFGWCNGIGTIRTHSHDSVFATLEHLRAARGGHRRGVDPPAGVQGGERPRPTHHGREAEPVRWSAGPSLLRPPQRTGFG
jgi:hypothetical protein